jgi:hypothetical protein
MHRAAAMTALTDHLDLLVQTHPIAKDIAVAKHLSVCRCIPAQKGITAKSGR